MRKLNFKENTIKDLGTLNRGQSMLLNLYIKGYTHVTLNLYRHYIELTVFDSESNDLTIAEIIIRNQMADGDTIEFQELENEDGTFHFFRWRGNFIETEDE